MTFINDYTDDYINDDSDDDIGSNAHRQKDTQKKKHITTHNHTNISILNYLFKH